MTEDLIFGLYAVTPDEADTERLAALVEAALDGGARLLQYRNKTAGEQLRLTQATRLKELCRRFGVPLIVNDYVDIALAAGADGVHIGRDDGDIAAARLQLQGKILGVSCYNEIGRAIAAVRAGADYVAFGKFFASATKPGDTRASLELVAQARRQLRVPIVAIGGITQERTAALIAGGISSVAVVSALFSVPDVRVAAQQFAALFAQRSS
jgi:thiamine-phosphate pyrophosphorylase